MAVRPRPPYSVGQFRPNQPFSPILRRNAVSSPPWYSRPWSAISARSAGVTFSARNCFTSATHSRWASSSSKSTQATLSSSCLLGGRTGHADSSREPGPDRLVAAPADQGAEGDRKDGGDGGAERRDV